MYFETAYTSLASFLGRIRESYATSAKQLTLALLLALGGQTAQAANQTTYDLTPTSQDGQLTRVKTIVEMEGSLKVRKADDQADELPLAVHGELFFDEKSQPIADSPAVIRHFWEGKASIRVGEKDTESSLRPERRLLVWSDFNQRARIHSPSGPLNRAELELVDVVGSSVSLESLLPKQSIPVRNAWQHDDRLVAGLLGLQEVSTNELTSRLAEVTPKVAKIDIAGKVEGSVDGVRSRIEVAGNYQFDRLTRHVKWLAISVKESRDVGLVTPGFEVVARIRTVRQRTPSSPRLDDHVLRETELLPQPGDLLLDHVSEENQYRLLLDRRWFVASQRGHTAVLRMVDDSDVLATCTMTRLPKLPAGKDVALEKFQSDVQQALGKHSDQLLQASESTNPSGLRSLRVVAGGTAGEVPVQWIYYHLSDQQGQRLSCIFTLEAEATERFASADEALTSSLQFLSPETVDDSATQLQETAQTERTRR